MIGRTRGEQSVKWQRREARRGGPEIQQAEAKPSEADTGYLRIAYQGSQVWSAERASSMAEGWEQEDGVSSANCNVAGGGSLAIRIT